MYTLLKRRIEKKTYTSKEEMKGMLYIYNLARKITDEQYEDLMKLLEK